MQTTGSRPLRAVADRLHVLIGAACSPEQIDTEPAYRDTLAREFNCIVAENCMKPSYTQPERGRFEFSQGDKLVAFAAKHNMKLRGHTLAWHNQLPEWLKQGIWTRSQALELLRDHVQSVAAHFRRSVFAWDVVNEALSDEGGWREKSTWFQLIGPDYLDLAFRWAHEAAPDAVLVYNDYGMEQPNAKADACYKLLGGMLARGVPVHAVGFQYHLGVENHLDPAACGANFRRFRNLGLDIHFTEMDMGIKKPITDGLRQEQAAEYASRMRIGLDAGAAVFVFWGFTDKYSWVPGFTKGEYDEPLLFTPDYQPKPAHAAIVAALK